MEKFYIFIFFNCQKSFGKIKNINFSKNRTLNKNAQY